jgi:Lrp/AsnC family transcriptional regulator, leucine-responsive regulatory protein
MAGDRDFLLRVAAPDLEAYRRFQAEHLARAKEIRNMKTEIPMQQIKLSSELPLGPFYLQHDTFIPASS